VAGTTIAYESVGASDGGLAHAVAAGRGGLPSRVDLATAALQPVTLAPGEERTLWIVFGRFEWPVNARLTLNLAPTAGEPLRVTLHDRAAGRPRWDFEPQSRSGLSMRLESQLFGTKGYAGSIGSGVWFVRGSLRLDLDIRYGLIYAQGFDALERAFTVAFGASLAWHPLQGGHGIYASAMANFADFGTESGLQDRSWSPSVSVGFESGSEFSAVPLMFYRLGYVHLFDDSVAKKDGFVFMVGKNVRFW